MAAHRFGEPVTDGEIDRALAAALAVEPSAAFVARVRMRIADEPEPAAWQVSWMIAAASCTIAVAIVITAMQMNHPVVPVGFVVVAVVGAVLIANVMGFAMARSIARVAPAIALRTE